MWIANLSARAKRESCDIYWSNGCDSARDSAADLDSADHRYGVYRRSSATILHRLRRVEPDPGAPVANRGGPNRAHRRILDLHAHHVAGNGTSLSYISKRKIRTAHTTVTTVVREHVIGGFHGDQSVGYARFCDGSSHLRN